MALEESVCEYLESKEGKTNRNDGVVSRFYPTACYSPLSPTVRYRPPLPTARYRP